MSIPASDLPTHERPAPAVPPAERSSPRSAAYAGYTLLVLVVAYVLAFMDRQVLSLLVEPLKRDLHLSDLQISLLQGLAFALFLSVSGLPLGRLVDRGRRTRLLALAVAGWSLMTGLSGLARGFPLLLAARAGVGLGEAAMTPSAYSLIGDRFAARRLGIAMGVYGAGPYLGSGLALLIGGLALRRLPRSISLLGQPVHGWQVVFLGLAAVGLVVALWVWTVAEPPRHGVGAEARPTWPETFAYFRKNAAALIAVNLCIGCASMAMNGLLAWAPSLLVRGYGLRLPDAGQALGWRIMLFGAAGALAAGALGDRLRRGGRAWGRLIVPVGAALAAAPIAFAAARAPSAGMLLTEVSALYVLLPLAIASGPAILQEITPNRLRGVQHALAVLASNLLGLGLGPLVVATVVDLGLRDERRLGEALSYTLPAMLALSTAAGLLAVRPYAAGLRQAEHA